MNVREKILTDQLMFCTEILADLLNGKEIDVELIGVALGDALDTLAVMKGNGEEECPTCVR